MTYLDTGCFVKLYYPEADSAQVIAQIQGKAISYTPLHELEFGNALQLKIFLKNATPQLYTRGKPRHSVVSEQGPPRKPEKRLVPERASRTSY